MTTCAHCRYSLTTRSSQLTPGATVQVANREGAGALICWERPGLDKSHQPAPSVEEQVEEALGDIETAVADARGDAEAEGRQVSDDDLYYELANSVLISYPPLVAGRVKARLGFAPLD